MIKIQAVSTIDLRILFFQLHFRRILLWLDAVFDALVLDELRQLQHRYGEDYLNDNALDIIADSEILITLLVHILMTHSFFLFSIEGLFII